jgi:hypothetical protein
VKALIRIIAIALLLALIIPGFAKDKKRDKRVPAMLGTARYVYVEAMDGDQFDPNLLPEDRQAIANVQEAIRKWPRYVLTAQRKDAELIFVARKGRLLGARGMVGTGGAGMPGQRPYPQSRGGVALGGGAEAGPPDDLLEVDAMGPDGHKGTILWRRTLRDGLDGPGVPLVHDLRIAVERDYPYPPPKTKANP